MKNLLILLFLLGAIGAKAQDTTFIDVTNREYTQIFDSISTGLILSRLPHNTLYNRVAGWAGLDEWSDGDTVSVSRAFQAWYDLEKSRTGTFTTLFQPMMDTVRHRSYRKILPLLIYNYNFDLMDSNAFNDGRLALVNGIFTDNNQGLPPYITKFAGFGALAADSIYEDENYTVQFDPAWIMNNTSQTITSVKFTNLATSAYFTLTPNGTTTLSFADAGTAWFKIEVTLSNNDVLTAKQEITIRRKTTYDACTDNDVVLESDIPFKGYDETVATTTLGNYSIYYHYLNGDPEQCEKTLRKPIIILDGFDPQDARPIGEIYNDLLKYTYNGEIKLGDDLRKQGYDVIILNFPKIGTEEVNKQELVKQYSYNSGTQKYDIYNGLVNKKDRDGGTDYIERNAFLLVKLIQQVNATLTANASTEKLVIVGPSMGGLISRYALAYMEKQNSLSVPNMNHNCRLWISFDSPMDGANVPIGTQQALDFIGNTGGNITARITYMQKMHTPATRQLLIDQIDGLNSQSAFRTQFMSNLTTNGLSNSHGYPVNLRKISLVNGSGSGMNTGNAGQQYFNTEAYINVFSLFNKKVFDIKVAYLNSYNVSSRTFKGKYTIPGGAVAFYGTSYTTNINNNGIMDIVPGGLYASSETFRDQIIKQFKDEKLIYGYCCYQGTHTFIPVVSALGFKNTSFNWSNAVNNRDLVCTNEIYFDNYYLPINNQNEGHVSLTKESTDWVKDEIYNSEPLLQGVFPYNGTIYSYNFGSISRNKINSVTIGGTIANTAEIKINNIGATGYGNGPNTLPGNFTVYSSSCGSNSTVNINQYGRIVIGDPVNSTYTGTLVISSGSQLIINNGGNLTIHNGSKLIIEKGATLIFNPGAQIELLGNDAILEIRGTLHIADNATFSIYNHDLTSGFVRFVSAYDPAFPKNITVGGNNAKFELVSNNGNNSNKILEVTGGEYIYPADNLKLFKVQDAKIALGDYCRLNIGCPLTLDHVTITSTSLNGTEQIIGSSYSGHRGVHVYGQWEPINSTAQSTVNITNCDFKNGQYGIFGQLYYGVMGPNVDNCRFTNCKTGIFTEGRFMEIYNSTFTDCTSKGWFGSLHVGTSKFYSSKIYKPNGNTGSLNGSGIYYQGNSANSITVEQSNIQNYYSGLNAGSGNIYVKCSRINNNIEGINAMYDANLYLDALSGSTYNNLSNNNSTISLLSAGGLYLENGYQNLATAAGGYCIEGTLNSSAATPIDANYNYWNTSGNPPSLSHYNVTKNGSTVLFNNTNSLLSG